MTNATQPKPNPLPAILVYGTPSSPALTQASWFRAEDKEAVKAAAEALKFSVIELQTDAEKALAAGVHEGVLKGSGRMIVGSVSAEVYRRIEEHVRKGASAPDPSKPENAAATASEQTTNTGARVQSRRTVSRDPGCAGDRQAGQRDRSGDPSGRREGPGRLLEREARVRGLLARHRQADRPRRVHPRVVRQPGISGVQEPAPGHRRSASRVPRLGQVTRGISVLANSMGRPSGRPSSFRACPEPGARHPNPQPQGDQAMTSTTVSTAERIRALNDAFRRTFVGGMVMITAGVEAMPRRSTSLAAREGPRLRRLHRRQRSPRRTRLRRDR